MCLKTYPSNGKWLTRERTSLFLFLEEVLATLWNWVILFSHTGPAPGTWRNRPSEELERHSILQTSLHSTALPLGFFLCSWQRHPLCCLLLSWNQIKTKLNYINTPHPNWNTLEHVIVCHDINKNFSSSLVPATLKKYTYHWPSVRKLYKTCYGDVETFQEMLIYYHNQTGKDYYLDL